MKKRIGVIMYQTSASKGQELVAQRMVRDLIELGNDAYLITSIYHNGTEVMPAQSIPREKGYILTQDPELEIPVIRVDSYIAKWPPRRIFFRNFVHTLSNIVDELKLNVLITHSTLWNGPEETAKFVTWRRKMSSMCGYSDAMVLCQMSHYQEPNPNRYSVLEQSYRMAWNKLALPQVFTTANLVLAVTPIETETMKKMGAAPDRMLLFPGGVDETTFASHAKVRPMGFLKEHGIREGKKIISYVGSLEERKNPLCILEIAKRLKTRKDVHFVIAGRGETSYVERIRQLSKKMRNVTFLGEIDEKEKVRLVKATYANIIMSKLEALGLVQMEFMYGGVPIITSAAGGQSWLVRNGIDGIHVNGPSDIEGAEKAILQLVDNKALRTKMSANAKKRAKGFACLKITKSLDAALNKEVLMESGLNALPKEVHMTLAEPEKVLRTWIRKGISIVATDKRIFVVKGRAIKEVVEIPYPSISAIGYAKRYSWRFLGIGILLSLVLTERSVRYASNAAKTIFSPLFLTPLEGVANGIAARIPAEEMKLASLFILGLTATIFLLTSRSGFLLHGNGIPKIYLPYEFHEAIMLVRRMQDEK